MRQRRQRHVRRGVLGVSSRITSSRTRSTSSDGGTAAVGHHIGGSQVGGNGKSLPKRGGVVAGVLMAVNAFQFAASSRNIHGRAGGPRPGQQAQGSAPRHQMAPSSRDPTPDPHRRRGVHRGQEFDDHSPATPGRSGAPRRQRRGIVVTVAASGSGGGAPLSRRRRGSQGDVAAFVDVGVSACRH